MRASLARQAVQLCAATVTWNVTVGGVAVATAIATGSSSLIGFGINAVVDSSVSALLVWRFGTEKAEHAERAIRAERIALRLAGAAFSVIAVYVLGRALAALVSGHRASSSLFGVVEAAASLVVLPYLAIGKYRLSRMLQSSALRADSLLTVSGIALAAIALAGLALQRAVGWWWADPVAGLAIAGFLAWQGASAFFGPRRPGALARRR
jgi:divalent metal cation (Fe/Co/Zn/Cd) transporter